MSWTPGRRDFPSLIACLASDDRKLHGRVEAALLRAGLAARDWLIRELPSIAPPVRARAVRALARFLELADGEALFDCFAAHAVDPDPRTRRAAFAALGRQGAAGAESILLAAWDDADAPTRRAIVEALGKVGGESSRALLESLTGSDPELNRLRDQALMRLQRSRTRAALSRIDAGRAPTRALRVRLRCRAGLEDIVRDECPRRWKATVRGPGAVEVELTGPLESLFQVRTAVDFAFPIGPPAGGDSLAAVAGAIASDEVASLVDQFTEGQVRYRLEFAGGGKHRAAVYRLAEAVAARRPAWINDPQERCWEVTVLGRDGEGEAGFSGIELRPRLPDPRFGWRVADVPASSHPTLAAALARVAGVRRHDVVWDPFAGSGSELIERALLGPYERMHGGDTDPDALAAARANVRAAGLSSIELRQADAFAGAPAGITLVLTNPPMGRRVHRRADLRLHLDRFVELVARSLVDGGRLVWMSPHGARTAGIADRLGLHVELRLQVDMGGFPAELQLIRKGRAHR